MSDDLEIVAQTGWCPKCDTNRLFFPAAAYRSDSWGWCCKECKGRVGEMIHK